VIPAAFWNLDRHSRGFHIFIPSGKSFGFLTIIKANVYQLQLFLCWSGEGEPHPARLGSSLESVIRVEHEPLQSFHAILPLFLKATLPYRSED
jgi:hypothetical protein